MEKVGLLFLFWTIIFVVITMEDGKKYNLFIFISSFARNLVEIFSGVLLYKMGYSIKDIMLFFGVVYFFSIFINVIVIKLDRVISSKSILIFSSLMFSISYYFFSKMSNSLSNLIIFGGLYSLASFSYHPIRHIYGIEASKGESRKIGNIVIFTYIGSMLSGIFGGIIFSKFNLVWGAVFIFIISFMGIFCLRGFKESKCKSSRDKRVRDIGFNRILFFILEQFKVAFFLMVPLYLYLNVDDNIMYIGYVNVLTVLSAIIFVYFFVKRDIMKLFPYFNILFVLVLLLKLNISSKVMVLAVSFLEGFFLKMYEVCSTKNMYMVRNNDIYSYLTVVEIIFSISRTFIFMLGFIMAISLKGFLYISLVNIFISGFLLKKKSLS